MFGAEPSKVYTITAFGLGLVIVKSKGVEKTPESCENSEIGRAHV